MEDQVTAHLRDESGKTKREAVSFEDFDGVRAFVYVDAAGKPDFGTSYPAARRPPQGEEGAIEACLLLVHRLRQDGDTWNRVEREPGLETGVDCRAYKDDTDDVLLMSVTRVGAEEYRRQLAKDKAAESTSTAEEAADQMMRAIARKQLKDPPAQRRQKVLVVDAHDVPAFAIDQVRDEFARRHGAAAADLGYQAVWLVGPTLAFVYTLDGGTGSAGDGASR